MPEFIITALDKPNAKELRLVNRPKHLEHIKNASAQGIRIIMAGPLLDDDGNMMGSHLIVSADNKMVVEKFVAQDPYQQNGVFGDVIIRAFRKTIPAD